MGRLTSFRQLSSSASGWSFSTGKSASKAIRLRLSRLGFGEEPFDLLLLDNRLPKESGIDLVKRVRERSVRSKVIFMTAYETTDVKTHVKRLEVEGYLRKPFDLTVLVN